MANSISMGKRMSVTLITQYRYSNNSDRAKNLAIFISYYSTIFDNIIIVEQDVKDNISDDHNKFKYIFVYNDGEFNRSWGFNVGAIEAIKDNDIDILFFCDIDVLIEEEAIDNSLRSLKFDKTSVNPYQYINHLSRQQTELFEKFYFNIYFKPQPDIIASYAGGALFMTKDLFLEIKGWNEDFRGWGGEDNAMDFILQKKCKKDMHTVKNKNAVHLFHKPDNIQKKKKDHPFYENNLKTALEMSYLSIEKYIKQRKQLVIGCENKYIK